MKKFSSSLIWLTISEIIFNISAYIVHSVAGRILGPTDYGRYGLVVTLTTMVIVLIGNGIPTAMSKYISGILEKNPADINSIKKKTALLQIYIIGSVALIFFLLSPIIAWALRDPSLTPLFRISSLIIPVFAAASFYHYYLIGLHLFKLQAAIKIIRSLARVGFITLATIFFGLNGSISGYILAPLFTFGIALLVDEFYIKRKLNYGIKNNNHTFNFPTKTILAYAGPLTLFLIFYELILTIDIYFVKALLQNDYLTGLYNAAITIGRVPYYLFAALAMIMLPAISKTTTERNTKATKELVTKAITLLILILFPLITLLSLYASQTIRLFYGDHYAGAETTMSIFTIGVGFFTFFYVLSFTLNGAGLVKIPMKLSIFGFIGMLALSFIFIPKYGIVGAALATTLISFILMIGIFIFSKIHFKVKIPYKLFVFSIISSVVLIAFSNILPDDDWTFIISGTLLFALHFIMLHFFKILTFTDLKKLANK